MADTVGMADIRKQDLDSAVKGFALTEYIFANLVNNSRMTGDSIKWYQETATELSAISPGSVETSPLAKFHTLEPSWTRNISYFKKWGDTGLIAREDIKGSDIDVLGRTMLRLTRKVTQQVDSHIYNVMTESQSPSAIGTAAATAPWDTTASCKPILDILKGLQNIAENNYKLDNIYVAMNPQSYTDFVNYLIASGSAFPSVAGEVLKNGVVGKIPILNTTVIVSNQVVADSVWVGDPKAACTLHTFEELQAQKEEVLGQGTKIAVWMSGVAVLTDPKASYLISNTKA